MIVVTREPGALAKSDASITFENVAGIVLAASRIIEGEALPNFEDIVAQNEISFAQKRRDIETVERLLTSENAVVPALETISHRIRQLRALSETIDLEAFAKFELPAKPHPDDSLVRHTLRRLHYVQNIVKAVAKWLDAMSDCEPLKRSAHWANAQRELREAFWRVIVQIQQAAIVMGKYRDMGDISVLREMTLDAEATLNELQERARRADEARNALPIFERVIEERQLWLNRLRRGASIAGGGVLMVALSFGAVKFGEFALPPLSDVIASLLRQTRATSPIDDSAQSSSASNHRQEPLPQTRPEIKPAPTAATQSSTASATNVAPKSNDAQRLATKPSPAPQRATPASRNASEIKPLAPNPLSRKPSQTTAIASASNSSVQSAPNDATETRDASSKMEPSQERSLPKRKTIVIED